MALELWPKKHQSSAQELIDVLLDNVEDSGVLVNPRTMLAEAELVALASDARLSKGWVVRTILEMARLGESSVESFQEVFLQKFQRQQATAPEKELFEFYVPLRIQLGDDLEEPSKVTILGVGLEFMDRALADRRCDDQGLLHDAGSMSVIVGRALDSTPETYLVFAGKGTSWRKAWEKVAPRSFDALRGIVDMILSLDWRHGTEHPRTRIPLLGWALVKRPEKVPQCIHFMTGEGQDSQTKPLELRQQTLEMIRTNAEIVREKPESEDSILWLIANCFQLYSEAMDAPWNHECLLALWQLAEALTLSAAFGGDTKKVADRLAEYGDKLGLAGTGYRYTLRTIADKRNDIVHKGVYGHVKDDDVNVLKFACEQALMWLIQETKNLPTVRHLEMYYRYRTANDQELKALEDILGYLRSGQTE